MHGDVDVLAAPGASLVVQGRGDGHGAGGRPDIVSGRDTDLCRRVILGAGLIMERVKKD